METDLILGMLGLVDVDIKQIMERQSFHSKTYTLYAGP